MPFRPATSLTVLTTLTPASIALRIEGSCEGPKSGLITMTFAPCATAAFVAAIAPCWPVVPLYQLASIVGHFAASVWNSALEIADQTCPPADLT